MPAGLVSSEAYLHDLPVSLNGLPRVHTLLAKSTYAEGNVTVASGTSACVTKESGDTIL